MKHERVADMNGRLVVDPSDGNRSVVRDLLRHYQFTRETGPDLHDAPERREKTVRCAGSG